MNNNSAVWKNNQQLLQSPDDQVRQLNWVKAELLRLQEVYQQVLQVSPDLKSVILDFEELMGNLFTLIKYAVLLAKQIQAYYFGSEEFSFKKMLDLLNQVEEAQQIIISQIEYLIDYYNDLATQAGVISEMENTLIPRDAYLYAEILKRYIDLELAKSKNELVELGQIHPTTIQSLDNISRNSEHACKQIYIEIQRVISRVIKCYIALASQANVNVDKTVYQTKDIIEKENAVDPYQQLCKIREEELNDLVSNMEWSRNLQNRFLMPKVLDYVSKEAQRFLNFFENNEKLLQSFTKFVREVFEKTSAINPCKKQTETVYRNTDVRGMKKWQGEVRDREIMLIISDKLPMKHRFSFNKKTIQLKKGSEFIIKFGVTYFDQNKFEKYRINTRPTGYVQIFLLDKILGVFDDPEVHELYVGKKVYLSLNEDQTNDWRDIILLSIMSVGIKYSVNPPEYLQRYLIKRLRT